MEKITKDKDYSFLEDKPAEEVLAWAFKNFGKRCAIGTSLQKTGLAIIDISAKVLDTDFRVFFVDTLKFPRETYDLLEEVEDRYSFKIERYEPNEKEVEKMHQIYGTYIRYSSFGREYCCKVRKVNPSEKALETLDVWISGLRASQSESRKKSAKKIEVIYRKKRPILKINPLIDWTEEELNRYTRENKLPYNKLYDYCSEYGERYHVIGCSCCHIPILPNQDIRSGKFPWESGSKECGLHVDTQMEGSGI